MVLFDCVGYDPVVVLPCVVPLCEVPVRICPSCSVPVAGVCGYVELFVLVPGWFWYVPVEVGLLFVPVVVGVPVLPVCGIPAGVDAGVVGLAVGVVCALAFRVRPAISSAPRIVTFFIPLSCKRLPV